MTISPLALAAKKVIDAAWLHGDAYDLSSQAAFALESAQLLQSPETAAEVAEEQAVRRSVDAQFPKVAEFLAEKPPLTVFRASHESIVFGLYTTREAAQAHCEAKVRQEEPAESIRHLSWSTEDIGDMAVYELEIVPAEIGELIRGTGYVVTPLEVASEYDAEADE
ncbi:hypothetical protein [Streptomyces phaeochromogenes]|uniref:hypothetical protein n=1 Tax=Streptomyces phaeochromogenes TaxID=1923 RepID=UPI002DD953E0|nr:hypothetical protein [Streptomyces phaeochromogenes]WRZ32244.1 hypothetical protein OG931_33200 [Streptomyces phaeochromogenes]